MRTLKERDALELLFDDHEVGACAEDCELCEKEREEEDYEEELERRKELNEGFMFPMGKFNFEVN